MNKYPQVVWALSTEHGLRSCARPFTAHGPRYYWFICDRLFFFDDRWSVRGRTFEMSNFNLRLLLSKPQRDLSYFMTESSCGKGANRNFYTLAILSEKAIIIFQPERYDFVFIDFY